MNEGQAIVDRRAKGRVDLGGEQVNMLPPLGSFPAEFMLLGSCGDVCNDRKENGKGRMGLGFFSFPVFFSVFILTNYPLLETFL